MSKTNYINYQVELTEANAPVIEKINVLLIPGYPGNLETTSKSSDSSTSTSSNKITLSAVKKVVTTAKKEHGMDFVNKCIDHVGGDTDETLAKNVSSIYPDEWAAFIVSLKTGPSDSDADFDEEADDDFGEEEEEEIDAEAVKTAVRAYASEHGRDKAKAVMKKQKIGTLSDVDDLSQAKLTKLLAAVA